MEDLLAILHEDADLLVVNKPAGLVCHPTKAGEWSSLIGRARLYLNCSRSANDVKTHQVPRPRERERVAEGRVRVEGEKPFVSSEAPVNPQPCLVNRLDRETSGVVLIAKNSRIAGELGKLWESRAVHKEYLAIVHGHVRDDRGLIDAPLGRDERSRVAVKDCVRPDGAPAQTEYRVERRFNRPRPRSSGFEDEDDERGRGGVCSEFHLQAFPPSTLNPQLSTYSLLRVFPLTGRKHQLRLHLAHLGHPIVGDKLYGGDEDLYLALVENRLTPEQWARLILPNHALHACAVRFVWRGRPWEFACPPEPWFTDFLSQR